MLYATADFHGNLPVIPEDCSVLLIAGDICPDYVLHRAYKQAIWLDKIFRMWLDVLVNRDVQVVATWGNHDFIGQAGDKLIPELPWTMLLDDTTRIQIGDQSLVVFGTPWVLELPAWAFSANEHYRCLRSESIPRNTDIVLSHGPPRGYGDLIGKKFGGPRRVGDETLNDALNRVKPEFLICGHIHEAAGSYRYNDQTTVMNVSYLDENYQPRTPPVKIYG